MSLEPEVLKRVFETVPIDVTHQLKKGSKGSASSADGEDEECDEECEKGQKAKRNGKNINRKGENKGKMGKAGPKKEKSGATEPKPKTMHNEFIGKCLRDKHFHGDLNHKERFTLAVKAWKSSNAPPLPPPPAPPAEPGGRPRWGCGKCRRSSNGCRKCNPDGHRRNYKRRR